MSEANGEYPPVSGSAFPHLAALLCDAEKVRVTWRFDEQQADPIHRYWTWDAAREELRRLLTQNARLDRQEEAR